MLLLSATAAATDYTVDFSRVQNLESLRPLVKGCADFDAMEAFRAKMESTPDLESMRPILSGIGMGLFNDCPDGITGGGIAAVKQYAAAAKPGYSVDFTRVRDFETLRPLVMGCGDFGGMEQIRGKLEAAKNLNDLAASLKDIGFGMFDDCPAGVSGAGIAPVR